MKNKLQYYLDLVEGTTSHPPIANFMGFKVVHAEKGLIVIEMICTQEMLNSVGAVQGGMIATIADASMGMAAVTMLDDEHSATTVELKINYLRPPGLTRLKATGRIIHSGKRLMMGEADVVTDEGKLVSKATSTLMIIDE